MMDNLKGVNMNLSTKFMGKLLAGRFFNGLHEDDIGKIDDNILNEMFNIFKKHFYLLRGEYKYGQDSG